MADTPRRTFLKTMTAGAALLGATGAAARAEAQTGGKPHLACNQYNWFTFYRRDGKTFGDDLDADLAAVAQSGVDGFEPGVSGPADLDRLAPLLKKHGLDMRSIYVNSTLHDPAKSSQSIETVLAVADKAQALGVKILVTNPTPIRWGGPENKSDKQLIHQAKSLDRLGAELHKKSLTLAYHNHDAELRLGAREFHHMLIGTDPANVKFCLDSHWVFRGAGDSQVALFDAVTLYADRIVELHLRQSRNGVWSETLGFGDIDYRRLADRLLQRGLKPHLVIEQAVEKGSPKTLDAVEAHRISREFAAITFGKLA